MNILFITLTPITGTASGEMKLEMVSKYFNGTILSTES